MKTKMWLVRFASWPSWEAWRSVAAPPDEEESSRRLRRHRWLPIRNRAPPPSRRQRRSVRPQGQDRQAERRAARLGALNPDGRRAGAPPEPEKPGSRRRHRLRVRQDGRPEPSRRVSIVASFLVGAAYKVTPRSGSGYGCPSRPARSPRPTIDPDVQLRCARQRRDRRGVHRRGARAPTSPRARARTARPRPVTSSPRPTIGDVRRYRVNFGRKRPRGFEEDALFAPIASAWCRASGFDYKNGAIDIGTIGEGARPHSGRQPPRPPYDDPSNPVVNGPSPGSGHRRRGLLRYGRATRSTSGLRGMGHVSSPSEASPSTSRLEAPPSKLQFVIEPSFVASFGPVRVGFGFFAGGRPARRRSAVRSGRLTLGYAF